MERKWEHSKMERYAEKWWRMNGYQFEIKKEWVSKTVYTVRKDNKELEYVIYPSQMKYFKDEMIVFTNYWDMYFKIKESTK